MKRIVWLELGSYLSRDETQHYARALGVVCLTGAWRSTVPWTSFHLNHDRAQISRLELQISLDPLALVE